jgi:1,2-diacylglycerol 3-beta-glucosyltransferase
MLQLVLLILSIPPVVILLLFTLRRLVFMLAILLGQRRKFVAAGTNLLPDVLILVSCRDEAPMINDLCLSLSQLDYPREALKVVLIDDGSIDDTGWFMEQQAGRHFGWDVLRFSRSMGKASALNRALERYSFGEIIYVFDADHRPDPQVLRRAVRYFSDPQVAAVTGFTQVVNPIASPSAFYCTVESYTNQLVTIRAKDRLDLAPALLGSNCGYRRAALLSCGGFRAGAFSEDSDMTVTLYRAGYRIRFAEDAVSYQQVPQSVNGYLTQHIRWGRGLNDIAGVHSRDLFQERNLPLLLRLELLLFTAGYLDRIALMSAVLLMAMSYVCSPALALVVFLTILLSLLTPFAQIFVLFLTGNMPPAMWIRMPLIPLFFALDILAAIRAMVDTLLNRTRRWTHTERVEFPQ